MADRAPDDGEADVAALADALVDAMWRRSPRQVCLVVDDVHEVGDGDAAALLAALAAALPANGHLVLSGRADPPVPLARLAAQGLVERLDEADLAFADEDLAAFAALRAVPVDQIDDLGGWPALVELRAAGSGDTVDDFLTEEVLAALSPDARHAVAVVAALGGADQALLDAVSRTGRRHRRPDGAGPAGGRRRRGLVRRPPRLGRPPGRRPRGRRAARRSSAAAGGRWRAVTCTGRWTC